MKTRFREINLGMALTGERNKRKKEKETRTAV